MSGEQIRLQESTAGSRRWSGSEFQTVGPTTENAWVSIPKGATTNSRTTNSRGTDSWWHLANRRCWRPGTSEYGTHSPRYLGAEDNDGLSQQTCCLHCTRWGITSHPVQVVLHQPRQTARVRAHRPNEARSKFISSSSSLHRSLTKTFDGVPPEVCNSYWFSMLM